MEKVDIRKCKLAYLEDTFELQPNLHLKLLDDWLIVDEISISEFEQQALTFFQQDLIEFGNTWNEQELRELFIGTVFALAQVKSDNFHYFSERNISAIIGDIELQGRVDAMIAKGRYEPKLPYVCMNQYKREIDPDGDINAQTLAAMLVAQEMNGHHLPVYGVSIKGAVWRFLVLNQKDYAISIGFGADTPDLFDIVRILKKLKKYVSEMVAKY